MRTIAIGDIHGCAGLLDKLLSALQPTPDDVLIFLGDYVDRGPDSRGVLDRLIELKKTHQCIFLGGNHELMMMRARESRGEMKTWLQYGGAQTLGSYGSSPGRSGTLDDVPEAHWQFFEQLYDFHETTTHIFVHAGLAPDKPLAEQAEEELFWMHLTAPIAHVSGKTIICGHTSQKSGEILDFGTIICIDTYAFGGGHLTALNADTLEFWQIDILGQTNTGRLAPRGERKTDYHRGTEDTE